LLSFATNKVAVALATLLVVAFTDPFAFLFILNFVSYNFSSITV
jgi:hypothetical protein